jgi:hypothetical protein
MLLKVAKFIQKLAGIFIGGKMLIVKQRITNSQFSMMQFSLAMNRPATVRWESESTF